MIQVAALHINTDRHQVLSTFYGAMLGQKPAWSAGGLTGFMVGDFRLEVAEHDQISGMNNQPARLFFDLLVDDVGEEFERIVKLGASVIQEPYEFSEGEMKMVISTLADPDGNYFQLVSMNTT